MYNICIFILEPYKPPAVFSFSKPDLDALFFN